MRVIRIGHYRSFGFRAAAPMALGAMRHAVAPALAAGAEQPVVPGARGGACSTPRVASAVPRRRRQARGARRAGIYRTHWQQHSGVLCSCPRWDGLTQAIGPPPLLVRTHPHARAPAPSAWLRIKLSGLTPGSVHTGEAPACYSPMLFRRSEPAQEGGVTSGAAVVTGCDCLRDECALASVRLSFLRSAVRSAFARAGVDRVGGDGP